MAVTYDGLIEEIEKVATKCGVEDLEFLAGPDWTIPLLKEELARWKFELKRKTEERRAAKRIIANAKDFFVKSDKVFKGDAYIVDCEYVLPGPIAKNSLLGDVFLQIDDDFVEPIRGVLLNGNSIGVWYIDDITKMKQEMTIAMDNGSAFVPNIKKVEDETSIRTELTSMVNETYTDIDDFITIPKQTDPKIFTRKKVFRLEMGGAHPVLLNIQLIPTVTTEEMLEEVEFCLKPDGTTDGKIPVYYVRIRISFSHYIANLKYRYT